MADDHSVLICNTVEPYLPALPFDVSHARVHCNAMQVTQKYQHQALGIVDEEVYGGATWVCMSGHAEASDARVPIVHAAHAYTRRGMLATDFS